MRHNNIRDLTAKLLGECCSNVSVGPTLTPLSGEKFNKATKTEDEARPDVVASGLWTKGCLSYSDVRIFNPLAKTHKIHSLVKVYKRLENEKKSQYLQRVVNVEHGTFTPLIFTCFGGMSRECQRYYNRIAELISEKKDIMLSKTTNYIRTKLSFSLLRSIIMSIRGSRTSKRNQQNTIDIDLESAKSKIN